MMIILLYIMWTAHRWSWHRAQWSGKALRKAPVSSSSNSSILIVKTLLS